MQCGRGRVAEVSRSGRAKTTATGVPASLDLVPSLLVGESGYGTNQPRIF